MQSEAEAELFGDCYALKGANFLVACSNHCQFVTDITNKINMVTQVEYVFRTLDSEHEETYQNTGISMKGSPGGVWNQFLYDRGSSKGQVVALPS